MATVVLVVRRLYKVIVAAIGLLALAVFLYATNSSAKLQLVLINNSSEAVDSFTLLGSAVGPSELQQALSLSPGEVVEQGLDLQPNGRLRFISAQGLNRASGILIKRVERRQDYRLLVTISPDNRYLIEQK